MNIPPNPFNPSYAYGDLWCARLRAVLPGLIEERNLNKSIVARRARFNRQTLLDALNGATVPWLHTSVRISYGLGMRFADLAAQVEPFHVPFWEHRV